MGGNFYGCCRQQRILAYAGKIVSESELIIDRPKGSSHPKFKNFVYPVDYGYLKGTTSMDGAGIDVFVGSRENKSLNAVMCNVDILKKDSEIKLLLECTDTEIEKIFEFLNASEYMKSILIKRN